MERFRRREVREGTDEVRKEKIEEAVASINSNVVAQPRKENVGTNTAEVARRIVDNINANAGKKKK